MEMNEKINMSHGSGGQQSSDLMQEIFGKYFSNEVLDRLEDGAVIGEKIIAYDSMVVSTDSFVVTPIEFKGGDIGKLAVCGTVNDVLMMGAIPKYLTCGFILEEGLEISTLDAVVKSMAKAASEAKVKIVAGDTKVIEKRTKEGSDESGLMINTTGIGFLRPTLVTNTERRPSASKTTEGDVIIVSGNIGDHHASILSARMGIENGIKSDCADLSCLVAALFENNIEVHTMRDVTRGGLGTVLNEIASSSCVDMEIREDYIPVDAEVKAFCGIMGLDPVYMGNEGKFIFTVPKEHEALALSCLKNIEIGKNATSIGEVLATKQDANENDSSKKKKGIVRIRTKIGGTRRVDMLIGEGLPRIC